MTVHSFQYTLANLRNDIILFLKQQGAQVDTTESPSTTPSTITVSLNTLLGEVDLLIKDNVPKLPAIGSSGSDTISVLISSLVTEIEKQTAHKGSRLYNDQGHLLDAVAITSDESSFVTSCLAEAFGKISALLESLLTSAASNTSLVLTFSSNTNFSSAFAGFLGKRMESYYINYVIYKWLETIGQAKEAETYKATCDEIYASLQQVLFNKLDTLKNAFTKAMSQVEHVLAFVTTTPAVLTGDNYTFTILNGSNFNTTTRAIISDIIKKYMLAYAAYEWSLKIGSKDAIVYAKDTQVLLDELKTYVERKRDFIDKYLKKAAYKVYGEFEYVGKSLDKPVLYDEIYTYADEDEIFDEVTEFTIVGETVTATDKIYYRMLLHGYWDTSVSQSLDDLIEEALAYFVVKEFHKYKLNDVEYKVTNAHYKELISDIRLKLAVRQRGKQTRREATWL